MFGTLAATRVNLEQAIDGLRIGVKPGAEPVLVQYLNGLLQVELAYQHRVKLVFETAGAEAAIRVISARMALLASGPEPDNLDLAEASMLDIVARLGHGTEQSSALRHVLALTAAINNTPTLVRCMLATLAPGAKDHDARAHHDTVLHLSGPVTVVGRQGELDFINDLLRCSELAAAAASDAAALKYLMRGPLERGWHKVTKRVRAAVFRRRRD